MGRWGHPSDEGREPTEEELEEWRLQEEERRQEELERGPDRLINIGMSRLSWEAVQRERRWEAACRLEDELEAEEARREHAGEYPLPCY